VSAPLSTFRLLALCASPPGGSLVADRLRAAVTPSTAWDDLAQQAEEHGLEPLLSAHLRDAAIAPPVAVADRLRARTMQHAHACAVRTRVMADVARMLQGAGVQYLVLKGAALAHIVYAAPALRPMRDLDLLVRPEDASRAADALSQAGFETSPVWIPDDHHHLPAQSMTLDGVAVSVELHRQPLSPVPFVPPQRFDDLMERAQTFEWGGLTLLTVGREDMLWHIYAHAFVVSVLRPSVRLTSVADLVHAVTAWADVVDWERLRRTEPRLSAALPLLDVLTPWPPSVRSRLGRMPNGSMTVDPIAPAFHTMAVGADVLWPQDWWFRMRYGIDDPARWWWYRLAGHPFRVLLAMADGARRARARHRDVTSVDTSRLMDRVRHE
jgi:hypothetical protein